MLSPSILYFTLQFSIPNIIKQRSHDWSVDKSLSVQCVASSQHSSSQPPLCCWGDVTVWLPGWPTSPHGISWRKLGFNLFNQDTAGSGQHEPPRLVLEVRGDWKAEVPHTWNFEVGGLQSRHACLQSWSPLHFKHKSGHRRIWGGNTAIPNHTQFRTERKTSCLTNIYS